MRLDTGVRRPGEQCLKIGDVLVEAVGVVPVGPVSADVLRVALAEARPVRVREDVEVQLVEALQVGQFLIDTRS